MSRIIFWSPDAALDDAPDAPDVPDDPAPAVALLLPDIEPVAALPVAFWATAPPNIIASVAHAAIRFSISCLFMLIS
jgi:hypothetical protein